MTGMDPNGMYVRFAIAIGLGLLVGLQRERATELAGLRTFALITLTGFVSGLLSVAVGGWVLGGTFVALGALLVGGYVLHRGTRPPETGITTEAAALAMLATGAYLAIGEQSVAVVIGASIAVLLAFKGEIHGAADRLTETDVKAVMQFVLLSLVILPVLPDRTYGPYDVLNPRQVWWMVVLIVGVGLAGYIAAKFLPERSSVAISGVLGGLVSSTATTASYARRCASASVTPVLAAAIIIVASAVSMVRILAILAVAAPGLLPSAGPALGAMALALAALAWILFRRVAPHTSDANLKNPSEIRGALAFAAIYAIVLMATAAVKQYLGNGALYPLAIVSGLTDVDAISLSSARLFSTGALAEGEAWRLIVTAVLSNLFSKAVLAAFLGGRGLLMRIAPSFLLSGVAGLAFIVWA